MEKWELLLPLPPLLCKTKKESKAIQFLASKMLISNGKTVFLSEKQNLCIILSYLPFPTLICVCVFNSDF